MATTEMSAFVERYQLLYEKDPRSKVFAPLAEAYRKMGLLDEAIDLALRGVHDHPHFASGRVALGKCYVQKGQFLEASEQLKIAADLSPENLLAHQLLAECYSRLKKPVEALNAYKIVLFLNPNDTRVSEIVKNLEMQIYGGQSPYQGSENQGDDSSFEEIEEYTMSRVDEVSSSEEKAKENSQMEFSEDNVDTNITPLLVQDKDSYPSLERDLALLDSLYQRGDWGKVKTKLAELSEKFPDHPEIKGRKQYLDEITNNNYALSEWLVPVAPDAKAAKVERLKNLLERLEAHKRA